MIEIFAMLLAVAGVIVLFCLPNIVWALGQLFKKWLDERDTRRVYQGNRQAYERDLSQIHLPPQFPNREKKKLPEKWLQFEAELFTRPSESNIPTNGADRKEPK
jgi:hypothetical protein